MQMAGKEEDVIALVGGAGDGAHMDATVQQLLLQVQAQAQAQQAAGPAAALDAAALSDAAAAHHQALLAASEAMANAIKQHQQQQQQQQQQSAEVEEIPVEAAAAADGKKSEEQAVKRKSIPLSMKKEAIEWIMGPGKGIPSRAEKHFSALNWEVSASSFRKWWKNRDKILGDSSTKKRISGGGRKPYLEDAEEKLLVVVIQERAKKDRVTRKWIAKTAQHMFQRSGMSFKASENWVTKFIRRNGLTLKRSYVTYNQNQAAPNGAAQLGTDAVAFASAVDASTPTSTGSSGPTQASSDGLDQHTGGKDPNTVIV